MKINLVNLWGIARQGYGPLPPSLNGSLINNTNHQSSVKRLTCEIEAGKFVDANSTVLKQREKQKFKNKYHVKRKTSRNECQKGTKKRKTKQYKSENEYSVYKQEKTNQHVYILSSAIHSKRK